VGRVLVAFERIEVGLREADFFGAAFFAAAFFFEVARAVVFFAAVFFPATRAVAFFFAAFLAPDPVARRGAAVFFFVAAFAAFFAADLAAAELAGERFSAADFPGFNVRPAPLRSRVSAALRDFDSAAAERPPRAAALGEPVFFLAMRRQV